MIELLKDKDIFVQMSVSLALGELKDPRAVAPLIAAMSDKNLGDGRFAIMGLQEIGAPAVGPLIAELKDEHAFVRMNAAYALARIRDSRTVDPLIAALRDPDAAMREAAADALGATGDPRVVGPLIAALKESNAEVRSIVAKALGGSSAPGAIASLVAALKDPNANVRRSAAEALGNIKDSRVTAPLIAALNDTNSDVRSSAVEALGRLKGPSVVDALIAALKDKDTGVRMMAALSLGELKDTRAVEPLISVLGDPHDKMTHTFAADALGEIKDPRAVGPLMAALTNPRNQTLGPYSNALGKIGAPAVDPLFAALKDKNTDIRRAALAALGKTKDARATAVLVAALDDPDSSVRNSASIALGELGDPRAVGPLIKSMKEDQVLWLREFDAQALGDIGAPTVEPLIAVLNYPDGRSRRLAAGVLARIKDPRAVMALLAALQQRNYTAIAGAYMFFVDRGEPGSEDALIEALNRSGSEQMAEYLLNCGNAKVEAAARVWAKRHNPEMKHQISGVLWGSAREMPSSPEK
jgi:HEAT repeat protein